MHSAQPGGQPIGKDRQHHRAFAADIIRDDAADDTSGGPAEYRRREDITGVTRDLCILCRIEQLAQSKTNGQEQSIDLKAVKQPSEVRGDQNPPLLTVERSIPK